MRLTKIQDHVNHKYREEMVHEIPQALPPQRQKFISWAEKITTVVGISGQTLFYFQAYKIFTTSSANDVSTLGFSFATLSLVCWLLYGLIIKNKVLIIVNTFALIGALLTLVAIFVAS